MGTPVTLGFSLGDCRASLPPHITFLPCVYWGMPSMEPIPLRDETVKSQVSRQRRPGQGDRGPCTRALGEDASGLRPCGGQRPHHLLALLPSCTISWARPLPPKTFWWELVLTSRVSEDLSSLRPGFARSWQKESLVGGLSPLL